MGKYTYICIKKKQKIMNKTKIYYQPARYIADDNLILWDHIPEELMSFQVFATRQDCKDWLEKHDYDLCDYAIGSYDEDEIENVTILDSDGNVVEIHDETDIDEYDFDNVVCKMVQSAYKKMWELADKHNINRIIFKKHEDTIDHVPTAIFSDDDSNTLMQDIWQIEFNAATKNIIVYGVESWAGYVDDTYGDYFNVADVMPKLYECMVKIIKANDILEEEKRS